jgi:hypothetical protein
MTQLIDNVFFKDLQGQNPENVCRRALCSYNDEKKYYLLSVWGDEYAIYPYEQTIEPISKNIRTPHEYLSIFIIHYLLRAKATRLSDEWISEKDIPGGPTFFRGPHEIPTSLISSQYSGDIKKFGKICEQLGGALIDMADAAYVFKITPRIPVAVLYWEGDDDFLPESKLLFDKSITQHLALDIIFALAVDICTRIGHA